MDTITHAISGAVIGAATSRHPQEMRRRALWGALFAAFPDTDAALMLFTDMFTYLNEHRGYTHSVIMLPLWSALLGLLASYPWSGGWRLRWREYAVLAAAALAAHILGDLITSYGTKVFKPLYDAPLAFPITFIIDPIFTLILLAGLVAALWRKRPAFAAASAAILLAYLSVQVFAQQQALRIAAEYATTVGNPSAPVIAFPQPLSPFNWKIVVVDGDGYHRAYLNLLADAPRERVAEDANVVQRLLSYYQPPDALEWRRVSRWPDDAEHRSLAYAAWHEPAFEGYRKFALLPYVTSMRGDSQRVCVWFTDLRFTLPLRSSPFEYAMCRSQGVWTLSLDEVKAP